MSLDRKIVAVRAFVPSDDDRSNSQLLDEANAAVASFESKHGWRPIDYLQICVRHTISFVYLCDAYANLIPAFTAARTSGRIFRFKKPPPARPPSKATYTPPLRQWGDLTPEEVVDVSSLEEFKGTDFLSRLSRHKSDHVTGNKRKQDASSSVDEPDIKRARLEESDIFKYFKPYGKAPLTPIPPYTKEVIDDLFEDTAARGAWLIPLRGVLPWQDAWGGCVLALTPATSGPDTTSKAISWTQDIIKKLWEDLCTIRKNNTLGPISLSFGHSSSDAKDDDGKNKAFAAIKIHHNIQYSLYVRAVLDSWRPKSDSLNKGSASAPRLRAPRPMQNVKLVLLDEDDQAIGVC